MPAISNFDRAQKNNKIIGKNNFEGPQAAFWSQPPTPP